MTTAIKVENVSKAYQLGQFSTGTLSRDIHRWWALVRGKEDPFLKIGETNDRTSKGKKNIVWSLKDLNFEINQGDAIGIIGKNGAGKSTLLKILSQVTTPTSGSIKVKGRVASLLEVGTGFHPELTGRENIYLNGAILGMRKSEITRKFDEIVDFSGVERYIDTPVKRYSSGMYVRLAFAVAAHLESEILIVDEVLAVGDAEFQKKCLGKMDEISKGQGRTILFVSHNMDSISKLCNHGILLENGLLKDRAPVSEIITKYLLLGMADKTPTRDLTQFNTSASYNSGDLEFLSLTFEGTVESTNVFSWDSPIVISLAFKVHRKLGNLGIGLTVATPSGVNLFTINNFGREFQAVPGEERKIRISIDHDLCSGFYVIHLGALENGRDIWWHTEIATFEVTKLLGATEYPSNNAGLVLCSSTWEIDKSQVDK